MWYLKKIPKIVHFYFGGKNFEYLRYLSVRTFVKLNPDWEVNFYYPKIATTNTTWDTKEQKHKQSTIDYFQNIKELPVQIKEVDFEQLLNVGNHISEVHKSDFLRLHLLSTCGGLWSDTDILYHKPMCSLEINAENNHDIDTVFCLNQSPFYHYIGFLLASENNQIFKKLYEMSKDCFNEKKYQCIGTEMYSVLFPSIESIKNEFKSYNPINISRFCVYPYSSRDVSKLYSADDLKLTEDNIGVHWFGGHPVTGKFLEETDGGRTIPENIFLGKMLNEFNL